MKDVIRNEVVSVDIVVKETTVLLDAIDCALSIAERVNPFNSNGNKINLIYKGESFEVEPFDPYCNVYELHRLEIEKKIKGK